MNVREGDGAEAGFSSQDRIYAGLRVLGLVAGVSYPLFSERIGSSRNVVLAAFAGFLVYNVLLYLLGWRLLHTAAKTSFYAVMAGLDLAFIALLVYLTGGGQSEFLRVLYAWVALLAFTFGQRGGLLGSTLALAVFLGFAASARFAGDPWTYVVQAGGMLMHGPLVGYLTERERRRADDLKAARDLLAEANQRLREDEAKLVQAEKLSSLGRLAAGVAHEINNPLLGVMGCVRGLRDRDMPDERRRDYCDTSLDGLERIRTIVAGLLDYARKRPLAPEDVDAAEVVTSILRLAAPVLDKRGVEVDVRIRANQVPVRADRAQLSQAVLNLILNAAHAAPTGSAVIVEAEVDRDRTGIRVCDRGPGIPAGILSHVCDPFFTTKPIGEGTGLGLAVTLGIARAHGGDLEIETEEGLGTSVTIWLPGHERTPAHA